MPRFNSRGDYCAGVGGDGVVLSINGKQVFRAPSHAVGWINDDEVLSGTWTGAHDIRTIAVNHAGQERKLHQGHRSYAACGGGRWAIRPQGEDWLLDTNERTPLAVEHFGGDGSLVTWAWGGGGLIIAGRVIEPHAHCTGIQVFDKDTAIWLMNGQVHTIGMPKPKLLEGPMHIRAFKHEGEWWIVYQAQYNGQLVVHPFDSFEGYALNEPFDPRNSNTWAYRPDAISINDEIRVVWARIESEMPNELEFRTQAQFPPKRNLLDRVAPTPQPKPEPKPEPQPEEPTLEIPNLEHIVKAVDAAHPHLLNENSRASCTEFLWRATAALAAEDPGFGLLTKDPQSGENHTIILGKPYAVDAITYKKDGVTSDEVVDIMKSAGDGPGVGGAMWGLDERKATNHWAPVPPFPGTQPKPDPEPEKHVYDGGDNDTGECDICGEGRDAEIHKVTPKPDPEPEPTPDEPDYDGLLELIIARFTEAMKEELDKSVKSLRDDIASFRAELDDLTFEGRHRLLGTMTFTRKKDK